MVTYTSSVIFAVDVSIVKDISTPLYNIGVSLQLLYIFFVVRDLIITLYFFIRRDYMGFWKVIVVHLGYLPIDCFFILLFCIWGAVKMNSPGAYNCQ